MAGGPASLNEGDLHALADGRLDPERRRLVEDYLAGDPAAAERVQAWQAQNAALRALFAEADAHGAVSCGIDPSWRRETAALARRARLLGGWAGPFVRAAERARDALPAPLRHVRAQRLAGVAAVCLLVAAAAAVGRLSAGDPIDGFSESAVAAHVESLRHADAIRPRPANLAAASPAPPDLGGLGYRLLGVGPVAAGGLPGAAHYVYADGGGRRRVSLFVGRPQDTGEGSFSFARQGRRSLFTWMDGGVAFALVGEVGRGEMLRLAEAVHAGLTRQRPAKPGQTVQPAAHRM